MEIFWLFPNTLASFVHLKRFNLFMSQRLCYKSMLSSSKITLKYLAALN